MAAPSSQSPSVRTHFKTPEGRYKLSHEKTHPPGLIHFNQNKNNTIQDYSCIFSFFYLSRAPLYLDFDEWYIKREPKGKGEAWQVTLAHLKDKPAQTPPSSNSSSAGSGVTARFSAARLLGSGNGSRGIVFGSGNGFTGRLGGGSKGAAASGAGMGLSNGPLASREASYDGEGTYVLYNVADTLFMSDYNSQDKDPIKCLQFSSLPIAHTFDSESKDGHDLLIGLASGDVYSASLRQQLQDPGKKIVGATHYNKDGSITTSRCTTVGWIPHAEGLFFSTHADGNLYVYDKGKDGSGDVPFPPLKDGAAFSVAHARSTKSNPIARWHICNGAINNAAFSPNGMYLAVVGRDGYLRIFDYAKELLVCGCKSYFGALLCCAWSPDGKYVLTGGEDDLVQVWSMEDQRVVAWGEGHNSWVSSVAFDPHWTALPADESGELESVTYRFGSVGQDTQLLLWDLAMDEVVVPLRRLGGTKSGSPAYSGEAQSARWEGVQHVGTLYPAPVRKEVPKLAPVMAHRVHAEPLSGLIFAKEAILTACHEGHVKIWDRPSAKEEGPAGNTDNAVAISKEKKQPPIKSGLSQFKQTI